MAWFYHTVDDNSSMDIYDHTGSHITTLQNNDRGFAIPDDVYSVMIKEVASRGLQDTSEWQTQTIVALAAGDIQKGTPPEL